jgi:hypothetical protein
MDISLTPVVPIPKLTNVPIVLDVEFIKSINPIPVGPKIIAIILDCIIFSTILSAPILPKSVVFARIDL